MTELPMPKFCPCGRVASPVFNNRKCCSWCPDNGHTHWCDARQRGTVMTPDPPSDSPPWKQWQDDCNVASTGDLSEVQPWLSRLPFRMQGTVFAAVRGGDLVAKPLRVLFGSKPCSSTIGHEYHTCPWSHTDDQVERQLTQWLRWLTLRPADEREVDHPGSYMQSRPPHPETWKPSMLSHHPLHWYMHLAHAYEVVGFEMPDVQQRNDADGLALKTEAYRVYHRLVTALHLTPETREGFWARMTEDRIASGEIVS